MSSSKIDLNNSLGALLLGTIVSSILYGVMCLQSWHYFQKYSDKLLVRSTVSAVLVLESMHLAFSIHAIYYSLIVNYFDPTALLKATWSVSAIIAVTSVIQFIVNVFYVRRVYIISHKNTALAVLIALLVLVSAVMGLYGSIVAFSVVPLFPDFHTTPKIRVPALARIVASIAVDIFIATSLSIYLHTSKTGIPATNRIIDRLIVHAVNNGIITSIANVLCVVFAAIDKTKLIYFMIYLCTTHLYSNTMLSTLNSRHASRMLPTSGLRTLEFRVTEPFTIPPVAVTISSTVEGNSETGIEPKLDDHERLPC